MSEATGAHDEQDTAVDDVEPQQSPVADDDGSPDEAPVEAQTPARRGSTSWLAWTVAVALAAVAAVALLQWRAVAVPAATVDEATQAAVTYVLALSNWDAGDGLVATYDELQRGATDAFRPEIDDVFGAETRDGLVAIDAVSTGTILTTLAGEPGDGDPAVVEVVVIADQLVVTGPTADPVHRTERVTLLRMVRQDGTWLVDDLEMLSEVELAEEAA